MTNAHTITVSSFRRRIGRLTGRQLARLNDRLAALAAEQERENLARELAAAVAAGEDEPAAFRVAMPANRWDHVRRRLWNYTAPQPAAIVASQAGHPGGTVASAVQTMREFEKAGAFTFQPAQ